MVISYGTKNSLQWKCNCFLMHQTILKQKMYQIVLFQNMGITLTIWYWNNTNDTDVWSKKLRCSNYRLWRKCKDKLWSSVEYTRKVGFIRVFPKRKIAKEHGLRSRYQDRYRPMVFNFNIGNIDRQYQQFRQYRQYRPRYQWIL